MSLNHSKYLLIELPRMVFLITLKDYFMNCYLKGTCHSHPERNKGIVQDLDKLYQLVKAGALSQLTSSSLSGVMVKITEDFYTNDRESFNTFYCFRCTS